MKPLKFIFPVLTLLPLVITLIFLPFLPDQIPVHYGISGEADRWGSKYEFLFFPVITIFFGIFMKCIIRSFVKQQKNGKSNQKILLILTLLCLILFFVLNSYFLYTGYSQTDDLSAMPLDPYQLTFGLIGIILILSGCLIPRLKPDSFTEIDISSTLQDQSSQKKRQQIGGICLIIGGTIMILFCIFSDGIICLIVSLIILILTSALSSAGFFFASK